VHYTTFFRKNNPFSKLLQFCIICEKIARGDLFFVRNSKKIRLREKWGGNPKKWGKNCLALIFHIIKIETEKTAFGGCNFLLHFSTESCIIILLPFYQGIFTQQITERQGRTA
jgi:hypothetical protein